MINTVALNHMQNATALVIRELHANGEAVVSLRWESLERDDTSILNGHVVTACEGRKGEIRYDYSTVTVDCLRDNGTTDYGIVEHYTTLDDAIRNAR